jgi:cell division protein FtsA
MFGANGQGARPAMSRKQKCLAALDAGSAKTCLLVAEEIGGKLAFRGFGQADSKGWKRGAIINLEAAESSIRRAMEAAEEDAGLALECVVVGIGASQIKGVNSHGGINISSRQRQIQREDMRRAVEEARKVNLPPDRVVLHVAPQEFQLDSLEAIRDPLGMSGGRLEADVHVITAAAPAHSNLIQAVHGAGLEVEDTVFEALAAGEAMIGSDERELGVILADIGAGSTDVVVYAQGILQHSFSVPIGGDHFTNDIAVGLRTPIPEAERIKRAFGVALEEMAGELISIEVPRVGDRPSRLAPQREVAQILQPRAAELLELIFDELCRNGLERQVGGGVVFTGGGARLAGLCDLTEQALAPSARIGLAPRLDGLPPSLQEPAYAAAIGLLFYAQRLRLTRPAAGYGVLGKLRELFTGGWA